MALLISTWSILSIGFLIASIVPTARFAQPIGAAILYPMIGAVRTVRAAGVAAAAAPCRGARGAADLRGVASARDLEGRAVVGASWRRRGAGGCIRDLHGTLGKGVSLGVIRISKRFEARFHK